MVIRKLLNYSCTAIYISLNGNYYILVTLRVHESMISQYFLEINSIWLHSVGRKTIMFNKSFIRQYENKRYEVCINFL